MSETYRLTLRYDGSAYHGWQRHQGKPTIQGAVEAAVEEHFGTKCAVHGSGRTDRGVHADGQVAHFTAPFTDPSPAIAAELDALLADDIEVLACEIVAAGFHARDDAEAKTYRFEIWNAPTCPPDRVGRVWHIPGPLDVEAMRGACPVVVGEHDFASFAKKANYQRRSMVRVLHSVTLSHEAPLIVMRFRGSGFLHKMARNLVRAIVKVGEGRSDADELARILAACDRAAAPGTAPASGLTLESVEY